MSRFALLVDSIQPEQLAYIDEIARKSESNLFVSSKKLDLDLANLIAHENDEDFIAACAVCDELIVVAEKEYVISEKILNQFFSNQVKTIKHLRPDGSLASYRMNSLKKATSLMVFPGPILPLSLGSHQRAFNLLYNLSKNGVCVDVLITVPKNHNPETYKHALKSVCNEVFIYKNQKQKTPLLKQATREIEMLARKFQRIEGPLPDLFSERARSRATESCKRWVNSLYVAKKYRTIIVAYAWMLNCVQYIRHDKENFRLFCDTHDVQFIRNKSILNRKERLFYSPAAERRIELKALNRCDGVLAISVADENILRQTVGKTTKVLRASSGFDYAESRVKPRPSGKPIAFGFIGGQMSANVLSLSYIIDEWWPIIQLHSPESQLFIAGSIGNNATIVKKTFFDKNIITMGFVDTIDQFYQKIDVSLNPVVVQGGLNFKSVEAVFAGKHLFTNRLGQECLGAKFPAVIVDGESELVSFLEAFEFDVKNDAEERKRNQATAKKMFSNRATYRELINYFANQH